MLKHVLAGALLLTAIPVSVAAKDSEKVELAGVALQQAQTRSFTAGKSVVVPALMTVLQESGYMLDQADQQTGLVVAHGSAKSKLTYNIFWGLGKKKRTPVVSAFVEDAPGGAKVRLTLVQTTGKSRIYGFNSSDDEVITDPAAYQSMFDAIDKAVFARMPVPVADPQAGAPAAPATTTLN